MGLADLLPLHDAGQADAAVVQITQDSGEPCTILVDGGDGDKAIQLKVKDALSAGRVNQALGIVKI